ncbi:Rv3654c family TadE-like protein [Nocardioides sp.]|uniref:Rv3654c family TadE-like protein n=1 Tax=Nocardioides sp. TaxID=35761 RepID=UPI0035192BE6
MTTSARPAGQRGAATLLVVALCGVLMAVGAATAAVGALVVDHRRTQAAADLAALAAAGALTGVSAVGATGEPCAVAGRIATANGAEVIACDLQGDTATITVARDGPRWLGQAPRLRATARAGPAPGV